MKYFKSVTSVYYPIHDERAYHDGYKFELHDTDEVVADNAITFFVGKSNGVWYVCDPDTGLRICSYGETRKLAVEYAAMTLRKYGVKYIRNCVDINLVGSGQAPKYGTRGYNVAYNAKPRYRKVEERINERRKAGAK